jgi:hypothetical protein
MEFRQTQTADRNPNLNQFAGFDRDDETARERLNQLLAINAETARQKAMHRSTRENLEAEIMKKPVGLEKTFSNFGLLLGIFPPAAMFIKFAVDMRLDGWVFGVMLIINIIAAIVGFFSGKVVGRIVRHLENQSWSAMILALPIIGLLWGAVAGAAGGIVIFIFGAFFGAILGGLVGAAGLPLFTILHRLMKKGEAIEQKHFLPIAFGVTLIICSFILGL